MLTLDQVTYLYCPGCGVTKVSLQIAQGECLGVTGRNGSGKSTLLALMAAALVPQEGGLRLTYELRGARKRTFASSEGLGYRRKVGYLSEGTPLYPEMTVKEFLRYRAQLKGERYLRLRRRVHEAVARCQLEPYESTQIGQLSYGLQRRVALAEAILLLPPVLILDDPFSGLDPAFCATLEQIIVTLTEFAHIVISGHDREQLKRCCSRMIQLDNNQIHEVDLV